MSYQGISAKEEAELIEVFEALNRCVYTTKSKQPKPAVKKVATKKPANKATKNTKKRA